MSNEIIGGPCKSSGQQGVFDCCGEGTKQQPFALTEAELKLCAELPDVLNAIADAHDAKASMAAAIGYAKSMEFHAARADELRTQARRIEECE